MTLSSYEFHTDGEITGITPKNGFFFRCRNLQGFSLVFPASKNNPLTGVSPVIKSGIRHPRKKEKKYILKTIVYRGIRAFFTECTRP